MHLDRYLSKYNDNIESLFVLYIKLNFKDPHVQYYIVFIPPRNNSLVPPAEL